MLKRVVLVGQHFLRYRRGDPVVFVFFRVEELWGELLEQHDEDRLSEVVHQTLRLGILHAACQHHYFQVGGFHGEFPESLRLTRR